VLKSALRPVSKEAWKTRADFSDSWAETTETTHKLRETSKKRMRQIRGVKPSFCSEAAFLLEVIGLTRGQVAH
jgi:hypothetical protein